jgi:AraC-like DNA-binding protein
VIALCFLPPPAFAQVRRALPPPHQVRSAPTWDDLADAITDRRADVAIVDPCTGGDRLAADRLRSLTGLVKGAPSIAVIGYVSVTAAAIRAVESLVRLGAAGIVVRGVDDGTEPLAAVVHRAMASSRAWQLLHSLGDPMERLPARVGEALGMMFRHPDRVRSVSDLATAARTTRRSLDRWLARAGLAPARTLMSCARANAAFHLVAGGGVPAAHAAALLGYTSARALTRELRSLTGHHPTARSKHPTSAAFGAAVSRRLVRTVPMGRDPRRELDRGTVAY